MDIKDLINKYVLSYISANKDMDEDFFIGIVSIYVRYYHLEDYLVGIKFSKKSNDGSMACYYPRYKIIAIYADDLNKGIKTVVKYVKKFSNDIELIYISYLIGIQNLIHELDHVKQKYLFDKEPKTIEEKLLCLENQLSYNTDTLLMKEVSGDFDKYMDRINKFLTENYDSRLCERLAQHYSLKFVISLLSDEFPYLKDFFDECVVDNLLRGYEEENGIYIAPTYRIINGLSILHGNSNYDYEYICNDYELTKEKVKTLDFDTRFKLGLPVTSSEFVDIV